MLMNVYVPFLWYSLKVGLVLFVLYGFYRLFLYRLTLYTLNRYYLLGYGLVAVMIPLLNTNGWWSPTINRYTAPVAVLTSDHSYQPSHPAINSLAIVQSSTSADMRIDWLQIATAVLLTGILIMLLRLLVQVISLVRIRYRATLLNGYVPSPIRLYAMEEPVAPFSIGQTIFIHAPSHPEEDLPRIIAHEVAHIKHGHTVDILLCQLILAFQWWNPFAWMLDRSVRQNLEFLADASVLNQGADPKQYQYLLLKVSGCDAPVLANGFNFSPLKNRIAMMNKKRSPRLTATRLLFSFPLLILLLAAFSRHQIDRQNDVPKVYHYLGYIVDIPHIQPIEGVMIKEKYSGLTAVTDATGFFRLDIPVPHTDSGFVPVFLSLTKPGMATGGISWGISEEANFKVGYINFFGMNPVGQNNLSILNGRWIHSAVLDSIVAGEDPYTKSIVFADLVHNSQEDSKVRNAFAGNELIYQVIDGVSQVASHDLSLGDLGRVVDLVLVDGKPMTGEDVNRLYKRSQVRNVEGLSARAAKELYGFNQAALNVTTK
jgi:hypothetical protein